MLICEFDFHTQWREFKGAGLADGIREAFRSFKRPGHRIERVRVAATSGGGDAAVTIDSAIPDRCGTHDERTTTYNLRGFVAGASFKLDSTRAVTRAVFLATARDVATRLPPHPTAADIAAVQAQISGRGLVIRPA